MKSRIGGSEISPVRDAFITINKVYFPAIWMVGADGDTLITKDSQYKLVFHKKIILRQKRSNELNCSTAN